MSTMNACLLTHPGSPINLIIDRVSIPQPGMRDVCIRVAACGLNPVDWKLMHRGLQTWSWPHIPGLDIAGEVDAMGEQVRDFELGDRVMVHLNLEKQGGLAEYAIADPDTISLLPDDIDFTTAASLPCAALTAWLALTRKLQIKENETLLVQAGAGGVGGFAIQMARHLGAEVIATCSRQNFPYVNELGAIPIDYKDPSFRHRIMDSTHSRGLDAILEAFGGNQAGEDMGLLKFGGRMACLQGLPPLDRIQPFTISPSLHEISLGGAYLYGNEKDRKELASMGNEVLELLTNGALSPLPIHRIKLNQAAEVLIKLSEGVSGKPGKRVVIIEEG